MVATVDMEVLVGGITDSAVELTFHEGEPEEIEIWVPLSVLDTSRCDFSDVIDAGKGEVTVKKWFLKKNDIPYPSDVEVR